MRFFLAVILFSSVAIIQSPFAQSKPTQQADASSSERVPGSRSALPPTPPGKSTVIGGVIGKVDSVRDQITLNVFGAHRPVKILFDARTQLYLNGTRTPLRDLRPEAHASVETVLDGTNIFARSIHVLSQSPEGEFQGQVISYDSGTGELTVNSALSGEPIQLRVPQGTPIARVGQTKFAAQGEGTSDFVKGTLVSIRFSSNNNGRGIAKKIEILATPGSVFVFSGDITFLDMHARTLVVSDPHNGKSYKITFDPVSFPDSSKLHQGQHVTVTATFDGTRYVASAIRIG